MEGMRSAALQEHARPDARKPACGLEPLMRCKRAAHKQKRLVGELYNLDHATVAEPVVEGNGKHEVDLGPIGDAFEGVGPVVEQGAMSAVAETVVETE